MNQQDVHGEQSAQIAPVPRISIQAFCEGADVAAVIQEAMGDRRMNKAQIKVHMGGAVAAVEAYRNAPTPNLIVIESASDRVTLVSQLEELAEFCDAGTKVVVIGRVNDIILYRDLIGRGVSDYLVAPFSVISFIGAISALYNAPGASALGRIIAITSAKGGAGASTIAHNLAWTIATDHDMATILVDMDLGFGTAGLDFNQDPPMGVSEAVFAPERLDQNFVDRLLSKCGPNLSMLAAPATLERSYDIGETAFDNLIDILRATTPVAVLDVPHSWNAWTRRVLVGADEVVVVAAPELASLRNAKNILDQLRAARPNDRPARLVLNQVGVLKRPEIPPADFGKSVDASPTIVLPFDAKLFGTAANNGQMISEVEAQGKVAESIGDLARLLLGRAEAKRQKKTLLEPLLAKLSRKKA